MPDFEDALGQALLDGRMSVGEAYNATREYAGQDSLDLVFTPEEDRPEVVNGEHLPTWQELIPQ